MHAKEGDEYVPLHQEFLCGGAIENWLTRLVQRMRDTLKEILARAKASADHWESETPRERWLFDYPAQIALTASQIIWTEEVVCQFDAFQDGYGTIRERKPEHEPKPKVRQGSQFLSEARE